jgi:hypothetical protein
MWFRTWGLLLIDLVLLGGPSSFPLPSLTSCLALCIVLHRRERAVHISESSQYHTLVSSRCKQVSDMIQIGSVRFNVFNVLLWKALYRFRIFFRAFPSEQRLERSMSRIMDCLHRSEGGQNLNFAIPINDAKPLLAVPASQALLALPNEPEAAPVKTEATARTDNANPSLEETHQWMQDNTDLRHVTFGVQQAITIYADDGEIFGLGTEDVADPKYGGPIYAEEAPGFVINVNDGKPHRWQRILQQYDLTFDGCLMTVEHLNEIITSTGVGLNADAPSKWTLLDTHTFDLQHYSPQVTVQEQLTTTDAIDSHGDKKAPKGTADLNPVATITARATSHYNDSPIFFEMGYPFADRFVKALQYAITLCGGKTESF